METQGHFAERIRRKHNLIQFAKGTGLGVASVALWYVSFWVFKFVFLVPMWMFGLKPSWKTGTIVAVGCMLVLAIEGVRYGKQVFDAQAYAESLYGAGLTGTLQEGILGRMVGRPLGVAYVISQILLSAPRTAVLSIKAFRSVVFMNEEERALAEAAIGDLAHKNRWVPLDTCGEYAPVLLKLKAMEVVWDRFENDVGEIRISRSIARAYGAGTAT